jgi:hypothetical protein
LSDIIVEKKCTSQYYMALTEFLMQILMLRGKDDTTLHYFVISKRLCWIETDNNSVDVSEVDADCNVVHFTVPFSVTCTRIIIMNCCRNARPPLWSIGQSSWLQIYRSGFDSRRCQIS